MLYLAGVLFRFSVIAEGHEEDVCSTAVVAQVAKVYEQGEHVVAMCESGGSPRFLC